MTFSNGHSTSRDGGGFFVIRNRAKPLTILLVLCLVLGVFLYRGAQRGCQPELTREESFRDYAGMRAEYMALLGTFDKERPGRGIMDYPGNENTDYAKSYAMFLSAEVLRAANENPFNLSESARTAGYWLLDNADVDGDGIAGWGLPVPFDAYGDGTVNPKDTVYAITTAVAINALLDWVESDPNAPSSRIMETVGSAFEPFLLEKNRLPNGLLVYSLNENDNKIETFNPSVYMAGQMQRYSRMINDTERQERLRSVADEVMVALLESRQLDRSGGWYWWYSTSEPNPNEMAHAVYIIEGILQYMQNEGRLSGSFDWNAVYRHMRLFYSKEYSFTLVPRISGRMSREPPRLYDIGMYMHLASEVGDDNIKRRLYNYSLGYGLPNGNFAKYPVLPNASGMPPVINEYMSYLLYGWSSDLFTTPSRTRRTLWMLEGSRLQEFKSSEYQGIPFTFFNTSSHSVDFEFKMDSLQGRLIIDSRSSYDLPPKVLPVKVVEWNRSMLVVFTRDISSSKVSCYLFDLGGGGFSEIPLPEGLHYTLFRQAVYYNRQIIFVLFDFERNTNYLYRLTPGGEGNVSLGFDYGFEREFYIDERYGYRQQPHILTGEANGSLYLFSDSTIYSYEYHPSTGRNEVMSRMAVPDNYKVVETASDARKVFGLYKDINYRIDECGVGGGPFIIYDAIGRRFQETDFGVGIPYHLRVEKGVPEYSFAENEQDMVNLFLLDLANSPSSGMMSAGMNNDEGEVIWSQSHYLNGFVDVLSVYGDTDGIETLYSIKPQMKTRLDFELGLIDKMLFDGQGVSCRRFSINGTPVLHAVQTGKLLLLMKRYLSEVPNPIHLKSFEPFRSQVTRLDGHIETLTQAEGDREGLRRGRYYLKWPKGSPFWSDGAGIPYNHQNVWAAGVIFEENASQLNQTILKAVREISTQVVDYEGLRKKASVCDVTMREDCYAWNYWWGVAKDGWNESEGVSINTPSWHGDGNNIALPVYRTFDSIAILTIEESFPGTIPAGMTDYLRRGVESDGLELFLTPYLVRHNEIPVVSRRLALKYLRFASQPEMRNAVWSYRYFVVGNISEV